MECLSTLTAKGQTTVPREVRRLLGIQPRQKIRYKIEYGKVTLEAAGPSLLSLAGVLSEHKLPLSKKQERETWQKERAEYYRKKIKA